MPTTLLESSTKATGAIRAVPAEQVKACDFRAAGVLDASRLAPLSTANDAFARNLAQALNSRLGVSCEITIQSLDVAVCEAFVEGAAPFSYFTSLVLGTHAETAILQMDAALLLTLLDFLMGGNGKSAHAVREITEMEGQIAKELVKIIAQELQAAWRTFHIEVKVGTQQTPEQLLHTLPASATALVPTFVIKTPEVSGKFQLMLPVPSIAPFLRPSPAKASAAGPRTHTMSPKLAHELLETGFGVELAMLKGRVRANHLLNLSTGQILSLGVPVGTPVVLTIGGREAFDAVPVRSGKFRAGQLVERIGPGSISNSARPK